MKSKRLLALVSITLAGMAVVQAEWMGLPPLPVTMAPAGTAAARVKPEDAIKALMAFPKEANEMAAVAGAGDAAATKEQLGKLSATCKGCRDDFRIKDRSVLRLCRRRLRATVPFDEGASP